MIEVSIASLFIVVVKLLGLIVVAIFSAVIVLWPVSEQPVSKTQKVIFAIVNIIAALIMFGVIKFV